MQIMPIQKTLKSQSKLCHADRDQKLADSLVLLHLFIFIVIRASGRAKPCGVARHISIKEEKVFEYLAVMKS
jgi:hypothetical protein